MANREFLISLGVLLLAIPTPFAYLDFFSSTLKTKILLETHGQLLNILREYASSLSETIYLLDRYLSQSEVDKISSPWPNDGDPLRTYVLIRRTTLDLDSIVAAIRNQRSLDPLIDIDILRQRGLLPGLEDMKGISRSLVRLQRMYLLQPKDIVQGKITENVQLPVALSASDCLHLGQQAEELVNNVTIPLDAKLWYQAGLETDHNKTETETPLKEDTEIRLQERLQDIKNKSKKLFTFPEEFQDFVHKDHILSEPIALDTPWTFISSVYRRLCRGENLRAPSMDANTFCHLRRGPHPYMKIRPLKVEVKSLDPYLVVLHDIVGNSEMEKLQEAAKDKADRSSHIVANASSGVTDIRVSATSWLPDSVAPSLAVRLGQYLGMHSNASKSDVEEFQVLNYGVGGHYNIHRDYFEDFLADRLHNTSGERIATLMIYLSDVEEGGWTVFPYAGLALKPMKGSAAFWWNLRSNGLGDYRSTHGGCPVLYGTKWVSNKWFRMRPQMFRLPCRPEGEDIVSEL